MQGCEWKELKPYCFPAKLDVPLPKISLYHQHSQQLDLIDTRASVKCLMCLSLSSFPQQQLQAARRYACLIIALMCSIVGQCKWWKKQKRRDNTHNCFSILAAVTDQLTLFQHLMDSPQSRRKLSHCRLNQNMSEAISVSALCQRSILEKLRFGLVPESLMCPEIASVRSWERWHHWPSFTKI